MIQGHVQNVRLVGDNIGLKLSLSSRITPPTFLKLDSKDKFVSTSSVIGFVTKELDNTETHSILALGEESYQ